MLCITQGITCVTGTIDGIDIITDSPIFGRITESAWCGRN